MSTVSLVRPGLTTAIIGHLPAIKLRLRKKVPQLTFQDVRRARIPYYEALASELYESGCTNAAFLLLQLIEYEHDNVPETSDPVIEGKRLKNSKPLLNALTEQLRSAEEHKIAERYEEEIESLLSIARSLQDDSHRRWISRQFFLIAVDRCRDCCLQRTRAESLTAYYYASFLAAEFKNMEAIELLESAVEYTSDQTWVVSGSRGVFGSEILINVIYQLLYEVYTRERNRIKKINDELFEKYTILSHEAAVKSNLEPVLCESFLNYGDLMLDQQKYHEALSHYKQALKRAKSTYAAEKVCKISIRMAAAYQSLEEPRECNYLLHQVDKLTAGNRICECYAELQLLSGEIHFKSGRLMEAMEAFHTARDVCKHLKQEDKMIQACCFSALASGERHFGEFAALVRNTEFHGPVSENENLFKLFKWLGEQKADLASFGSGSFFQSNL
ncbi:uncharacterized protein LOC129749589 [Uranotaenia lowii]|uniref:uncharacterized protein LOC129749589 n=1 Tax=Uranotaenia lowii TaxID=190385 RepID=UPI00247987B5|nr:uncharacterized protein LOC129749589 [Uranotaenia lowii]